MAPPPLDAGAVQVTVAEVPDTVAVPMVGAPGTDTPEVVDWAMPPPAARQSPADGQVSEEALAEEAGSTPAVQVPPPDANGLEEASTNPWSIGPPDGSEPTWTYPPTMQTPEDAHAALAITAIPVPAGRLAADQDPPPLVVTATTGDPAFDPAATQLLELAQAIEANDVAEESFAAVQVEPPLVVEMKAAAPEAVPAAKQVDTEMQATLESPLTPAGRDC